MVPRNITEEFNTMAAALDELSEMFEALDQYRKMKDQRQLFKVHSYECKARRLMNELRRMQAEPEQPQRKIS